jgi:hypothetical protein
MNDSGLKGNGGERDERGEGSGVTGPETQSGDCRKEKVVLQQEGLSTREGELRTDGLRVTDGVLKSENIQPTNQLLLLLQRQKHEEVEGLDGPVDGDRVLIMANGAYERNRIRNGRHWIGGQTTSMATTNGVKIRSWKCAGGMRCTKPLCDYKQLYGEENVLHFEMRGPLKKWYCFYCNAEGERAKEKCEAMNWTMTDEWEVAYCHKGKHNHRLAEIEKKSDMDKWQLEVMSMAKTDGSLTPSRAKQRLATGRLMEFVEKEEEP